MLNDPSVQALLISLGVILPVYLGLRVYAWRMDREFGREN